MLVEDYKQESSSENNTSLAGVLIDEVDKNGYYTGFNYYVSFATNEKGWMKMYWLIYYEYEDFTIC